MTRENVTTMRFSNEVSHSVLGLIVRVKQDDMGYDVYGCRSCGTALDQSHEIRLVTCQRDFKETALTKHATLDQIMGCGPSAESTSERGEVVAAGPFLTSRVYTDLGRITLQQEDLSSLRRYQTWVNRNRFKKELTVPQDRLQSFQMSPSLTICTDLYIETGSYCHASMVLL